MENRNSLLVDPFDTRQRQCRARSPNDFLPLLEGGFGIWAYSNRYFKVLLKLGGRFSSIAHGRMLKWQFPWAKAAWQEG